MAAAEKAGGRMMDQGDLFDRDADVTGGQAKALPPRVGPRRLRSAVRNQI
jgi:hypothetical protein